MLVAVGTKVRLKHTGDLGEVTALLSDGMVNVHLFEDDMEIPVALVDLLRAEEEFKKTTKGHIVPGKNPKMPPQPERPANQNQYQIIKSIGIQLGFDPIERADGVIEAYDIYLINDTRYDAIFSLVIDLLDSTPRTINGKLNSISFQNVGRLTYDNLNDAPIFDLECRQLTTAGTGARLFKSIKIKPKQFFNKITTAPLLDKRIYLYKVFENFEPEEKKEAGEDLKSYTKRNLVPKKHKKSNTRVYKNNEVKEFAEFTGEIDLHVERLTKDYEKLDNSQKLRLQLRHFEEFINKAYRLGVDSVFVIHGIGKGRLRDSIASSLIKNQYVKTFKNEYHPRYGYGATEVIFM